MPLNSHFSPYFTATSEKDRQPRSTPAASNNPKLKYHLKAVRSHAIKKSVPSNRGTSKSRGMSPGIFYVSQD